jgi:DNA polymerase elongation subunit (family B)
MKKKTGPKVLTLDIETAPLLVSAWQLFDQNIPLNMIERDWHLMSWAAKFLDEDKIYYMDQRNAKDIENDKKILEGIWKLIDEADVIVTQNGKRFDIKKLNARFLIHGMQPPSSFKHIDTCQIAKNKFGFTSNKLEYLSGKLCTKKKSSHKKFSGFDLWKECMKGNKEAWKEMESYNKRDVESTEELFVRFRPWDSSLNVNLYHDTENTVCSCGSTKFQKNGHAYTSAGKFARYRCASCGAEVRSRSNEFSKEKRESLKAKV